MNKSCKQLIEEYDIADSILKAVLREEMQGLNKNALPGNDFQTKLALAHAQVSPLFMALKRSNCRRRRRRP